MRPFYLLIFVFFSFNIYSQKIDTIYFDQKFKRIEKAAASYYRIIKKLDKLYEVNDYYINGNLQFTGYSLVKDDTLNIEGKSNWYYENGDLKASYEFKNNIPNGEFKTYYENGNLKQVSTFKNGNFDGRYVEFYEDKDTMRVCNFKNGLKNGVQIEYDKKNFGEDNPPVSSIYFAKNNKLDGLFLIFNHENDTVTKIEFDYGIAKKVDQNYYMREVNGSRFYTKMDLINNIETWKTYRDDKLIFESYYKHGYMYGIWKLYTFDGTKPFMNFKFPNQKNCYYGDTQENSYLNISQLELSFRFHPSFDFDIIKFKDCDSVYVQDFKEDKNLHPFYHYSSEKNNKTPSKNKEKNTLMPDYVLMDKTHINANKLDEERIRFHKKFDTKYTYSHAYIEKDKRYMEHKYSIFTHKDSSYILAYIDYLPTDMIYILDYSNPDEDKQFVEISYTENSMRSKDYSNLEDLNYFTYLVRNSIERNNIISDKNQLKIYKYMDEIKKDSNGIEYFRYNVYKNKDKSELIYSFDLEIIKDSMVDFNQNLLFYSSNFFAIKNIKHKTGTIRKIVIPSFNNQPSQVWELEKTLKYDLNLNLKNGCYAF